MNGENAMVEDKYTIQHHLELNVGRMEGIEMTHIITKTMAASSRPYHFWLRDETLDIQQ